MLLSCCLHMTPHPSSSSAIVYRLERCSRCKPERGSNAMLADGCLYFKKHLDILLHLSPITSCLPLHLSLSAWLCLSLSLSLSLFLSFSSSFFSSASYFTWFIVRQGVSVRPGLPLCVCEGVLLFIVVPAINHVFLSLWEDGGEKWRSMDRWYTGTRKKKDRDAASTGSSFCSGSVFTALLSSSSFPTCACLSSMPSLTLLRLFTLDYYYGFFSPLSLSFTQYDGSWL